MYQGERLNSFTHILGTGLAMVGSVVLVSLAARLGDPWKLVSFSIFGATLIFLYAASALFHSTRGPLKPYFAKLDHCAIYLLIAGTYTPITLVTLRGAWGWSLFAAIWILAVLGIFKELWWGKHSARPSVLLYVLMGWSGIIAIIPLLQRLSAEGMIGLAVGAVLYTSGTLFYIFDKQWPHAHGIWHLFVIGGSASHYFTVLYFVV